MRAAVLLAVMALVGGCAPASAQHPVVTASPVALTTPSPPYASTSPEPSPTPTDPLLPLTRLDFSCRLPINEGDYPAEGLYLSLPGGSVTESGSSGSYFDAVVGRWLPAPFNRHQLSPDGLRYAYTETVAHAPTRVHVVDSATGKDVRIVKMPDARSYAVVDFTTTGIDLLAAKFEAYIPGVWRVDVAAGKVARVAAGFYPPTATWHGVAGTSGIVEDGIPAPDRIVRRGADGRMTTWFYRPGRDLAWVPFADDSTLLVKASTWSGGTVDSDELWLVRGPGDAVLIASYTYPNQPPGVFIAPSPYYDVATQLAPGWNNTALADRHGIWMGTFHGLYLATPSGSILRVYDPNSAAGDGGMNWVSPAGSCD